MRARWRAGSWSWRWRRRPGWFPTWPGLGCTGWPIYSAATCERAASAGGSWRSGSPAGPPARLGPAPTWPPSGRWVTGPGRSSWRSGWARRATRDTGEATHDPGRPRALAADHGRAHARHRAEHLGGRRPRSRRAVGREHRAGRPARTPPGVARDGVLLVLDDEDRHRDRGDAARRARPARSR